MNMTQSSPLEVLRQAHQIGREELELLSRAIQQLGQSQGQNSSPWASLFAQVIQFFKGELRVHFRHEEEALFYVLQRFVGRMGPIQVMLDEHKALWRSIDALEEKLEQIQELPQEQRHQAARDLERIARHIAGLLSSHIQKEDAAIFPLAEKTLPGAEMQEVAERIEAIEE